MSDASLSYNYADTRNGGGLANLSGTANLTNVSIQGNEALAAGGKAGGVYVWSGMVTVTGGTIAGNNCGQPGGGTGACWRPGATFTETNVNLPDATQTFVSDPNANQG